VENSEIAHEISLRVVDFIAEINIEERLKQKAVIKAEVEAALNNKDREAEGLKEKYVAALNAEGRLRDENAALQEELAAAKDENWKLRHQLGLYDKWFNDAENANKRKVAEE